MKTIILFFGIICGAQVFGASVAPTLDQQIAALPPPVAAAVGTAANKSVDDLYRTKYAIDVATANLDDTFHFSFPFTRSLLKPVRQSVDNALFEPINALHNNVVTLLQKANKILQSNNNPSLYSPIGRILQSAIAEGTQCVQDYGFSASNALVTNTKPAFDALHRGEYLTTYPQLIQNLVNMSMNLSGANLNACQAASVEKANKALDTVQPQPPFPQYIGRVGDNLAGTETLTVDGLPYVRSLVADFLIDTLNKLNNLGTLLKPNFQKGIDVISDNRFLMTKALYKFKSYIDTTFALAPNDSVNIQFINLNEKLSHLLDIPIVQLIGFFVPKLVSVAGPILQSAPPAQAADAFKNIAGVIGEAISGANGCIPVVSNYATEAISSAQTSATAVTQSTSPFLSKPVLPRLFNNIQLISDEAAANVANCMKPFAERALYKLDAIKKSIVPANVTPAAGGPAAIAPAPQANASN